jgi:class 3 adenylate cyclase
MLSCPKNSLNFFNNSLLQNQAALTWFALFIYVLIGLLKYIFDILNRNHTFWVRCPVLSLEARYLPVDRLRTLAAATPLPTTAEGSALFADISGFTPITEKLRQILGARHGAETLAAHLNRVYDALIEQVEGYGGSIISFAGDAITCWFAGEDAPVRATGCAFALLDAMRTVEQITLPDGQTHLIGLKVSIAGGSVRRFAAGDPDIQLIDTLAGSTITRMAAGESAAERGEIVADEATIQALGAAVEVREWRGHVAVLEQVTVEVPVPEIQEDIPAVEANLLRPWLLPAIISHFQAGLGEYPTELRPAVAVFFDLTGVDY